MAMLLLKKKLLPSTANELFFFLRSYSPSSPQTPHFITSYLITTCNLTPDQASKSTKHLSHLKSLQNPNHVLHFLTHHHFTPTHIRRLILADPKFLSYNVPNTLAPNMKSLLALGFSPLDLPNLIIRNPFALILHAITPRFQFWKTLFAGDLKNLHQAFRRNRGLINHDIATSIAPKIALLKNYGLSDRQIQKILVLGSEIVTRSPDSIQALLNWTTETGFKPDSYMFIYGLYALACSGKSGFEAKKELLKSYGWTEDEFASAFRKAPMFSCGSVDGIRTKMEFLVGKAGCTPSYVARHPLLLMYSLEKRMMPRHHIAQILKAREMARPDFCYIMNFAEKMFVKKFIVLYQEKIPELHEIYVLACAGRFQFDLCQESSS